MNVNEPKGALDGKERRFVVTSNDQFTEASEYLPIIVAQHNGAAVPLRDVGTAIDAQENTQQAGVFNNKRAVLLIIFNNPTRMSCARPTRFTPYSRSCAPGYHRAYILM